MISDILVQNLLERVEALERAMSQMVVRGKISEVDPQQYLAKVQWGPKAFTGWLPIKPLRAGQAKVWWCPEVGEGVTVISPGDLNQGEIYPGSYTDTHPAPETNPEVFLIDFGDGAQVRYDREAHELAATLPAQGKAILTCPAGLRIKGDTEVDGALTVKKDTKLEGTTHSRGAISSDGDISDNTSSMQSMRDTYNGHGHSSNGAAPPAKKMG